MNMTPWWPRVPIARSHVVEGRGVEIREWKSGVSLSFLPEKTNRHRAKKARERCVGLSAISSLLQKGDSRVMSLGHPSYPRPKGTRNHSMAEKFWSCAF